jgi:hypothetical protein
MKHNNQLIAPAQHNQQALLKNDLIPRNEGHRVPGAWCACVRAMLSRGKKAAAKKLQNISANKIK